MDIKSKTFAGTHPDLGFHGYHEETRTSRIARLAIVRLRTVTNKTLKKPDLTPIKSVS